MFYSLFFFLFSTHFLRTKKAKKAVSNNVTQFKFKLSIPGRQKLALLTSSITAAYHSCITLDACLVRMQEDFSSIQDNGSSGRVPLNGDRHRSSFDFESSSLNGDSLSSSTNRKEHRFCSLPFLISFISLSISIYLIFSRSVSPIPPTSISPSPSSSGLTARRIFGPRIPRHYFFTSGVGRSNVSYYYLLIYFYLMFTTVLSLTHLCVHTPFFFSRSKL